jgi:hypothetical protein
MAHNLRFLALVTWSLVAACGKSDDSRDSGDRFAAPVISSSSYRSLFFVGQATDPSIPTSRLYRYDLREGFIQGLSSSESANAALFSDSNKVLLFNRQEGQMGFRVIEPGPEITVGPVKTLALKPGDPFDIAPLVQGKSVLLGEPLGGNLRILNYQTGEVSSLNLSPELNIDTLRPIGLWREGELISIIHTGLEIQGNGSAASNGSQQIFRLRVSPDGTLTYIDANPTTSVIDGIPLAGSNPSGFLNRNNGRAAVLSLCNARISPCVSGIDLYSKDRVTETQLWNNLFSYQFLGQIIDGSSDDDVYAHVQTPDRRYLLIKISLSTRSVEEIHTFQDERLYGIAFDSSSKTLFVGGVEDGFGAMRLYKAEKKAEKIQLDSVFYRGLFLNN